MLDKQFHDCVSLFNFQNVAEHKTVNIIFYQSCLLRELQRVRNSQDKDVTLTGGVREIIGTTEVSGIGSSYRKKVCLSNIRYQQAYFMFDTLQRYNLAVAWLP